MKIKFKKVKGQRIKYLHQKQCYSIEVVEYPEVKLLAPNMFYFPHNDSWGKPDNSPYPYFPNTWGFLDCKSLKAVIRKIHKWNVPRGHWWLIKAPWKDHEIKVKI